jgi:peptide deformylase
MLLNNSNDLSAVKQAFPVIDEKLNSAEDAEVVSSENVMASDKIESVDYSNVGNDPSITLGLDSVGRINIIKDKNKLRQVSQKVESVEYGEKIALLLLQSMKENPCIGLSAPQIGIFRKVFVVNVKEPEIFINPEIIEASYETVPYVEGCMSIPNKSSKTVRRLSIKVKADNFEGVREFGIKDPDSIKSKKALYADLDLLECVAIQHEYDHLMGILMTDRSYAGITHVRTEPKIGRNEKVEFINDNNEKIIDKYKNADKHFKNGYRLSVKENKENK